VLYLYSLDNPRISNPESFKRLFLTATTGGLLVIVFIQPVVLSKMQLKYFKILVSN
jgi:hypothetical protein